MLTSKNIKRIRFLMINAGFLMIVTVCIVARNKLLAENKFSKELIMRDSINYFTGIKNEKEDVEIKPDFAGQMKAFLKERSITISY